MIIQNSLKKIILNLTLLTSSLGLIAANATNYPNCANAGSTNSAGTHMNCMNQNLTTGWAADNINYYNKWNCQSNGQFSNIMRLNILPLNTLRDASGNLVDPDKYHHEKLHKDSLFIDQTQMHASNPTIYFTTGMTKYHTPRYSNMKAVFNGARWEVSRVNENDHKGGLSSIDGSGTNIIYNQYNTVGWGPFANNSTGIPGVSSSSHSTNAHTSNSTYKNNYVLKGSHNVFGLDTIKLQGESDSQYWDSPYLKTCMHMNPTLYNYNSQNKPQSMLAFLFTGEFSSANLPGNKGCKVNGVTLKPGYYRYRYNPTNQWTLVIDQVPVETGLYGVGDEALNYVKNSNATFIRADWDGAIHKIVLNEQYGSTSTTASNTPILTCAGTSGQAVYFSEAHATSDSSGNVQALFFLADDPNEGYRGAAAGLYQEPGTYVAIHDIFVAF